MPKLTRRRVLAALAVALSGLGFRRATALPVVPRIEPAAPMPPPSTEPIPALSEVYDAGWWVEPGGWSYHPSRGWMHCFRPPRDVERAAWFGPPPPRAPLISFDWGKVMKG